jgi:hypothetical protein
MLPTLTINPQSAKKFLRFLSLVAAKPKKLRRNKAVPSPVPQLLNGDGTILACLTAEVVEELGVRVRGVVTAALPLTGTLCANEQL